MADAADNKKMVIGYWAIRGLMQPIRMACALGNLEYEYKQYPCVALLGGKFDTSAWTSVKFTLGLDLPNLPYLIETDGSSFTESQAVLTYVCTKGGLTKEYSAVQHAQAHAFCLEVQNIRDKAVGLFYGNTWDDNWGKEGVCGEYAAGAKQQFERLEKVVAKNGKLVGLINADGFCAADIHLAEMVYQHLLLRSEILDECPTLKAFAKAFFEIEAIAKLEADCKLAINNKMAKWGNKYMDGPFSNCAE